MSHRFIRMPSSIQEDQENMAKFQSIAMFPTVIGAIDGTHIKIKKINTGDGQVYINRKEYASINVQVVCNAELKIMDIVARWHSSVFVNIETGKTTIVACAVHNIALGMNEDIFPEEDNTLAEPQEILVYLVLSMEISGGGNLLKDILIKA